MPRYRLTIEYDGTPFVGWQRQANGRSIQQALEEAAERFSGERVRIGGAGRTDAGVHAWGNVVSFDAEADDVDLVTVQRHLNAMLGPAIVVRSAEVAPPGFDARRSAIARRYRYTVLNRPVPDPFLAAFTWHVPDPLDLAVLRLACDPLLGEHDFTSFCRVPRGAADYSMVRRVAEARWLDLGHGLLRFEIEASSFCQQMVRAIVGTMVAMGLGRRRAGEMAGIVRARRRAAADRVAPPSGLCLWSVTYPDLVSG